MVAPYVCTACHEATREHATTAATIAAQKRITLPSKNTSAPRAAQAPKPCAGDGQLRRAK